MYIKAFLEKRIKKEKMAQRRSLGNVYNEEEREKSSKNKPRRRRETELGHRVNGALLQRRWKSMVLNQ